MASTSLSQRWLSEVEAIGTLINRKSLRTKQKPPCINMEAFALQLKFCGNASPRHKT
ncbi:hypothetical protein [Pseudanabaena yagii]|uniref:Transposase Tn5-like N-terminal domain-containing protein n=1 Tax=Pseudanabaena yagii GIHE-NHR1 TaxID=2722753 RepID=A0ABX1LZC2_9CYAN|nr:hypothetical protein [Pseudanabaena yagii]NMF60330.1 hypothetical protein [Pseudanabaena yagii GIHE-NHR1]